MYFICNIIYYNLQKKAFKEGQFMTLSLNTDLVENLSRFVSETDITLQSDEWKLLDENVVTKTKRCHFNKF